MPSSKLFCYIRGLLILRPSLLLRSAILLLCVLPFAACHAQDNRSEEPPSAPTTVFPHSDTAPWWVSGQINIIFQAHPDFHALYSGPHSLSAEGEHATSRVLTLYTGYEFKNNTEILFDLESAGGRGISDALGLAGFTNVDVVRNPSLGSAPYLARLMVHKVFALSNKEEKSDRTPTSLLPNCRNAVLNCARAN